MPGPRPQGDRALTSAERMRRLREKRKAEAVDKPPDKPPVVIRFSVEAFGERAIGETVGQVFAPLLISVEAVHERVNRIRPLVGSTAPIFGAAICWNGATSLISYRLPIRRADLDGTENRTTTFHPECLVAGRTRPPLDS